MHYLLLDRKFLLCSLKPALGRSRIDLLPVLHHVLRLICLHLCLTTFFLDALRFHYFNHISFDFLHLHQAVQAHRRSIYLTPLRTSGRQPSRQQCETSIEISSAWQFPSELYVQVHHRPAHTHARFTDCPTRHVDGTRVIACPFLAALAVRPTRWMYVWCTLGISTLMTVLTPVISNPRAAISVASR